MQTIKTIGLDIAKSVFRFTCGGPDVRYWPSADMPAASSDVRVQE